MQEQRIKEIIHADFIVYTMPDTLEHKKRDGRMNAHKFCYWGLKNYPSRLSELEDNDFEFDDVRIYFATKGFIRGYFVLRDVGHINHDSNEVTWYSESWKDIPPIPIKHFQGFKYADTVKELIEVMPNSSQD